MSGEIYLFDKRYNVSNMVEFSKEINNKYLELLYVIHEIMNGNKNYNKHSRAIKNIKKDVISSYTNKEHVVKREFYEFADGLNTYLKENTQMTYLDRRVKSLHSLLDKMMRYALYISPGKSRYISDLFGFRIVSPNNPTSEQIIKSIDDEFLSNGNLTYYLEIPFSSEVRNSNIKDPEVSFIYNHNIISWRGAVIEKLNRLEEKYYVNLLYGITLNFYSNMKKIFKGIARKVKSSEKCIESKDLCEYEIVDPMLRKIFGSRKMFIGYNLDNNIMSIITSSLYNRNVEKEIKELLERLLKIEKNDVGYYQLIKEGEIIRPHYGLEKLEIPHLFEKIGLKSKEFNPWEIIEPPREIIIKGNESSIYTAKVGYYKDYEATPIFEIQVMDEKNRTIFKINPIYKHTNYKRKEQEKAKRGIKKIILNSELEGKEKINAEKFLQKMYKEFTSI